jgi:hypothetical protein
MTLKEKPNFSERERPAKKHPIWQVLTYLLEKQIHFLVLAVAVIYLAYSWFSLQVKYAQIQTYNFESVINLSREGVSLSFYRDSGTNRPLISTNKGEIIMEFTDWASAITVNENTKSLWNNNHGYSVDAKNSRFFHAINGEGWTLFKEITIDPKPNRVLVEYYFRSNSDAVNLTLRLSHFRYHYNTPQIFENGFETLIGGSRTSPPAQQNANPNYKLSLTSDTKLCNGVPAPVKFVESERNSLGVINLTGTYTLRDIPANKRTLVACEVITWEKI